MRYLTEDQYNTLVKQRDSLSGLSEGIDHVLKQLKKFGNDNRSKQKA